LRKIIYDFLSAPTFKDFEKAIIYVGHGTYEGSWMFRSGCNEFTYSDLKDTVLKARKTQHQ